MPMTLSADTLPETESVQIAGYGDTDNAEEEEAIRQALALDAEEDVEALIDEADEDDRKKKNLIYEGPIAKLVTVDRFAAYVGYTACAVRNMCQRGMLPAHKMRNPKNPNGKKTWYINRKRWDDLAEVLPNLEPDEWHCWEDYWLYDRGTKKLKLKDDSSKQRSRKAAHRRSKLEIMMQEAAANE